MMMHHCYKWDLKWCCHWMMNTWCYVQSQLSAWKRLKRLHLQCSCQIDVELSSPSLTSWSRNIEHIDSYVKICFRSSFVSSSQATLTTMDAIAGMSLESSSLVVVSLLKSECQWFISFKDPSINLIIIGYCFSSCKCHLEVTYCQSHGIIYSRCHLQRATLF